MVIARAAARAVEVVEDHVQGAVRRGERLREQVVVAGAVRVGGGGWARAEQAVGAHQHRGAEVLAVVGRRYLVDVGGSVVGE